MLQIYTGNGKGKTTAAIGLAIRAIGAGKKVYIMQFMKGLAYSEQSVLRKFFPQLLLETTGKPFFVAREGMLTPEERAAWGDEVVVFEKGNPPTDYVALIGEGFQKAAEKARSGEYDIVILDELNVALLFELLDKDEVETLLNTIPAETELVLTGRGAPDWLIERADLVTDMREVKHYYAKGVAARRGIEN